MSLNDLEDLERLILEIQCSRSVLRSVHGVIRHSAGSLQNARCRMRAGLYCGPKLRGTASASEIAYRVLIPRKYAEEYCRYTDFGDIVKTNITRRAD